MKSRADGKFVKDLEQNWEMLDYNYKHYRALVRLLKE
jgi:hypothetical protein